MKKTIKSLMKIIVILLLLFITASVLFTVLVDINEYKNELVELVEKEAGLKLEINGDMKLTIFSGLKFNAENVKLSLGDELITDINSLHVGVDPYSLYIGEPEINSVELDVKILNIFRDKNNLFNFLPLYSNDIDKNTSSLQEDNIEKLTLNSLKLKDIKLSIEHFQYLDDLQSVSVELNSVKASLSLLPIIDHYDLVIDDPRILVDYTYSGSLSLKQVLINQYQIYDLSLIFKDQNGEFVTDKLNFNFIQEGANHAPPPLIFDAQGNLSFKLDYNIPEGASEPLWSQPSVIKVGKFDFNLPKFKLTQKEFQLESDQAHLVFEEITIFEKSKYALDDLLIKSLNLDGKNINVNLPEIGNYDFNQFDLELNNFPVIHKGKPLDVMSEAFLRKFSQKGSVHFSSDSLSHDSHSLNQLKLSIKSEKNKIALENLSFNALESEMKADGHLLLHAINSKELSKWQFNARSEKLNLFPLSKLLSATSEITGYATIDSHLVGSLKNSNFSVSSGAVKTKANNLLVTGNNIDKVLEDFQSSQSVGLLDVGAVALLGPAGVLVTKGNDYNSLMNSLGNEGTSKVKQLISEISFSDDIATMDDVAFSTEKYRLAVNGKINLEKNIFVNFEIATIDKKGCPVYKEMVTGSLESPRVKKVNVLVSGVMNPINSLVSKIKKPLNIHCKEPFYTGGVEAPIK
ncbi:MAG: AsmA family protein [Gammaproteobacteria bacterium]|nr:AsmA family protein [Gammaproteobacteria bacterium]